MLRSKTQKYINFSVALRTFLKTISREIHDLNNFAHDIYRIVVNIQISSHLFHSLYYFASQFLNLKLQSSIFHK